MDTHIDSSRARLHKQAISWFALNKDSSSLCTLVLIYLQSLHWLEWMKSGVNLTHFAKLRQLLSDPVQDDSWNLSFCSLLTETHRTNNQEYKEIWVPYCEQHAQLLQKPIKEVESIQALEEWQELAPFAFFSLYLSEDAIEEGEGSIIAKCPHLKKLQKLELYYNYEIDEEDCLALINSPYLINIQQLTFVRSSMGVKACQALANSPKFNNLKTLKINESSISDQGCQILSDAKHLTKLQALDLSNCKISAEGCRTLANSPHLKSLQRLNLSYNMVGLEGCKIIVSSTNFSELHYLNLGHNELDAKACQTIMDARHLTKLQTLVLSGNKIDDEDCRSFVNSLCSFKLSSLDLSQNRIGAEGCRTLAHSPNFDELQTLSLARNRIGDKGCQAIASSHNLSNLQTLDLYCNGIGIEGYQTLANASGFSKLQYLQLGDLRNVKLSSWNTNEVSPEGILALACSTTLPEKVREYYVNKLDKESLVRVAKTYHVQSDLDLLSKKEIARLIWQAKGIEHPRTVV